MMHMPEGASVSLCVSKCIGVEYMYIYAYAYLYGCMGIDVVYMNVYVLPALSSCSLTLH